MRAVLSSLPVITNRPSGLKTAFITVASCCKCRRSFPVSTSKTRAAASSRPMVTRRFESGLKAISETPWPPPNKACVLRRYTSAFRKACAPSSVGRRFTDSSASSAANSVSSLLLKMLVDLPARLRANASSLRPCVTKAYTARPAAIRNVTTAVPTMILRCLVAARLLSWRYWTWSGVGLGSCSARRAIHCSASRRSFPRRRKLVSLACRSHSFARVNRRVCIWTHGRSVSRALTSPANPASKRDSSLRSIR